LHDIEDGQLLSDTCPAQPALPPLIRELGGETITIPSLSEEGQYHVPHAMDFDALLTLIEAKRSECEDNMWALREDPGYFAEMAISRAEHRQESVLDVHGKEHPFKRHTFVLGSYLDQFGRRELFLLDVLDRRLGFCQTHQSSA
jgi:hypothetical protein